MARAPLVFAFLVALTIVPASGAAVSLRFASAPAKVWQEKQATVAIAVRPAGVRCTLTVRYADGSAQKGLGAIKAVGGKARWTWKVPVTADAGAAKLTVWCKGVGKRTRTMVVVGGTSVQAKLALRESGWTQRPDKFGSGSLVSYGILLENPDVTYDAVGVALLINFLNAEGRILGSKTQSISGIAAGSEFAAGGSMKLLTQVPVTRLEIVVTASKRSPRALHFPMTTAIGFEQATFDPGWVSAVAGELVNEHPRLTLSRAKVAVVVRDAGGAILGGGTAYVSTPLLPGTRILWKATTGLKAIPIERAASAQISLEPTWTAPGA